MQKTKAEGKEIQKLDGRKIKSRNAVNEKGKGEVGEKKDPKEDPLLPVSMSRERHGTGVRPGISSGLMWNLHTSCRTKGQHTIIGHNQYLVSTDPLRVPHSMRVVSRVLRLAGWRTVAIVPASNEQEGSGFDEGNAHPG